MTGIGGNWHEKHKDWINTNKNGGRGIANWTFPDEMPDYGESFLIPHDIILPKPVWQFLVRWKSGFKRKERTKNMGRKRKVLS